MQKTGERFNVFALESGSFVWMASFDTHEEAEDFARDEHTPAAEYLFIIEGDIYSTFDETDNLAALAPSDIAVTLRHDTKPVEFTPHNVRSALVVLARELCDLDGEGALREMMNDQFAKLID